MKVGPLSLGPNKHINLYIKNESSIYHNDVSMLGIMGFLFPIHKKMFPPLQLIIRFVPFVVITSGSYLLTYHQDWIAQTSIKFKSQLRLN